MDKKEKKSLDKKLEDDLGLKGCNIKQEQRIRKNKYVELECSTPKNSRKVHKIILDNKDDIKYKIE